MWIIVKIWDLSYNNLLYNLIYFNKQKEEIFELRIMHKNIRFLEKWSSVQIITAGFLFIILLGAAILSLPISSQSGQGTNFVDSLFTATSAVCVTGLVVFDTATHWSLFGKVVIISLIQIGGLGFMTIATMISLIRGKKINLKER